MSEYTQVEPPKTGFPLAAKWGRDVARSIRERTPIQGAGMLVSASPSGTVIQAVAGEDGKGSAPLPFDVDYFKDSPSRDGRWVIYLPNDTGGLISVAGAYIEEIQGVEPIEDVLTEEDTDWYTLENVELSDEEVWLNVKSESDGLVASLNKKKDDEAVASALIAKVKHESGSTEKAEVVQLVEGALVLGPDGGVVPDDISTEFCTGITGPSGEYIPSEKEGQLQIHGYEKGEPQTGNSLADLLITPSAQSSEKGSLMLVARHEETAEGGGKEAGVVHYVPLGDLTLPPTIRVAANQLVVSHVEYTNGSDPYPYNIKITKCPLILNPVGVNEYELKVDTANPTYSYIPTVKLSDII